ncbi:hypothetical protein Tco_0412971 [Tanacetum coccineum]
MIGWTSSNKLYLVLFLEFYSQHHFTNNSNGQFVVNFVIQNKPFSLTLEEFGQILKIPFKGQASITEMWSLDHLSVSVPTKGLYKTKPPTPRVIKSHIQIPRQGQETRTKNKETIVVGENEILTREIRTHMKPWVEIIRENVFCQGGHKDHVSALFKHVVSVSPELAFDHYLSYDRVMYPLAPHYERKPRADRGKKRPRESNASSSSNTQNPPSSSLQIDDIVEDNDNESSHSNPSSLSQNVSSSSHNVLWSQSNTLLMKIMNLKQPLILIQKKKSFQTQHEITPGRVKVIDKP